MRNNVGVELEVTSLGAAVTALRIPDGNGENPVDVVLGFDTAKDYLSAKNPYFGATVGRVANRSDLDAGGRIGDGESQDRNS